jgi:hypothetical protein
MDCIQVAVRGPPSENLGLLLEKTTGVFTHVRGCMCLKPAGT